MSEVRRYNLVFDACGEQGEMMERPEGYYVEHSDYAAALAKIAELEQVSGHLCPKCGWAMKFPDEPCRCELESVVKWIASQCNLFFAECSQAEEIVAKCNEVLKKTEPTPPKLRCTDRDDGCGHCERSEPHTHPDEQQGDECDKMGKKVKCEVVK